MWTLFGRISLLVTLAGIVSVNLAQDSTPTRTAKNGSLIGWFLAPSSSKLLALLFFSHSTNRRSPEVDCFGCLDNKGRLCGSLLDVGRGPVQSSHCLLCQHSDLGQWRDGGLVGQLVPPIMPTNKLPN